ncbi:monovalent cation/H(+) antiporter subunit G [Desulfosarcina sp.]|uniref:monovalent cation/H(+) antiporter subunit G n=1 Tax=Desulfosarcina sp. TaxID=2027861 RepID=UPI0039710173
MSAIIASFLLIIGSIFCLVAALGMLRLPDTLIRMHAATKAGTLGAGFILAAEAMAAGELGTTLKAVAVIVFLLLTAPVAAHLIGRAAYRQGIQLFHKTWIDELGQTIQKAPGDTNQADPKVREK